MCSTLSFPNEFIAILAQAASTPYLVELITACALFMLFTTFLFFLVFNFSDFFSF